MAKTFYLKNFIRFRIEKNHILLTDCSCLNNYNFPLKCLKYLDEFKKGIKQGAYTNKFFVDLFNDLLELEIITDNKDKVSYDNYLFKKIDRC